MADALINPEQNKDGNQVVDLTQLWPTARPVTGEQSDLVSPPAAPKVETGPGDSYYIDDGNGNHLPTDKNGTPLPEVDPATGEVIDPGAPQQSRLTVDVARIFDAENMLLKATNSAIDSFETFKNARIENEPWIFFAKTKESTEPYYHSGNDYNQNHPNSADGEKNKNAGTYADTTDPHPEQTAEIVQSQNALLQAIAGVIQAVGQYTGKLNDAAQLYAGADRSSWID